MLALLLKQMLEEGEGGSSLEQHQQYSDRDEVAHLLVVGKKRASCSAKARYSGPVLGGKSWQEAALSQLRSVLKKTSTS